MRETAMASMNRDIVAECSELKPDGLKHLEPEASLRRANNG